MHKELQTAMNKFIDELKKHNIEVDTTTWSLKFPKDKNENVEYYEFFLQSSGEQTLVSIEFIFSIVYSNLSY